jgi:hypothetical protein
MSILHDHQGVGGVYVKAIDPNSCRLIQPLLCKLTISTARLAWANHASFKAFKSLPETKATLRLRNSIRRDDPHSNPFFA